jgi:hypothetical protein
MQLQIDFTGKKTQRITFAADEDLEVLLKTVAKKLNRKDISELVREYAIECATRDMGKLLLMASRNNKSFVNMDGL